MPHRSSDISWDIMLQVRKIYEVMGTHDKYFFQPLPHISPLIFSSNLMHLYFHAGQCFERILHIFVLKGTFCILFVTGSMILSTSEGQGSEWPSALPATRFYICSYSSHVLYFRRMIWYLTCTRRDYVIIISHHIWEEFIVALQVRIEFTNMRKLFCAITYELFKW